MSQTMTSNAFSELGSHINACVNIFQAAENANCLPDSIKDLLPLLKRIQQTLASTNKDPNADSSSDGCPVALNNVPKGCVERAKSLHDIFNIMNPSAKQSETIRDINKKIIASKETDIRKLIDDIMKDLQIGPQVQGEAERASGQAPGSGPVQNIYVGARFQNIALKGASQANGIFSGGTFNFSSR